jgi:hypothetical protein
MKKIITFAALLAAFSILSVRASATDQSSGTLTVTATVTSSISMVFDEDSSGVALTGNSTGAATLAFGAVSAYYAEPANVTGTENGTSFTVSTPFDVNVTQANGSSANYALTAQLGSSDSVNTWKVDSIQINGASPTPITGSFNYGSDALHTLSLTVPYTVTSGISNTINFTASAN